MTAKQRIALNVVAAREAFANGPMAVDVAVALHPERPARSWSDVGAATALLGSLERRGLLRSYYDGAKRWRLTEAGQAARGPSPTPSRT